jgi:hypothetical protein
VHTCRPDDLDRAFRLATRSGMRLHVTDYHLISTRRAHFEQAETLVQETGYHRRDRDLAGLRAELAD